VDGATAVFSVHWMRPRQKGSEIYARGADIWRPIGRRQQLLAIIDPEAKLTVKWSYRYLFLWRKLIAATACEQSSLNTNQRSTLAGIGAWPHAREN
jgi:hypothetical protein